MPILKFLFADDVTGETYWVSLEECFVESVRLLPHGRQNAMTVAKVLEEMGKENTGTNHRKFRFAVEYVNFHSEEDDEIACSTTSGYFLAKTFEEAQEALGNKRKNAEAMLKRCVDTLARAEKKFTLRKTA